MIGWVRGVRVEGDHMCVSLSVVDPTDRCVRVRPPSIHAFFLHGPVSPLASACSIWGADINRLIGDSGCATPFNTHLSVCHINENVLGLVHVR